MTPRFSYSSKVCLTNWLYASGCFNCFLYTSSLISNCILWVKFFASLRSISFLLSASWCLNNMFIYFSSRGTWRLHLATVSVQEHLFLGVFGNLLWILAQTDEVMLSERGKKGCSPFSYCWECHFILSDVIRYIIFNDDFAVAVLVHCNNWRYSCHHWCSRSTFMGKRCRIWFALLMDFCRHFVVHPATKLDLAWENMR